MMESTEQRLRLKTELLPASPHSSQIKSQRWRWAGRFAYNSKVCAVLLKKTTQLQTSKKPL